MTSPKRRKRPGTGALGNHPQHSNAGVIKAKGAGAQAAQLVADPRFRRRVQHLERLGNRVTGELLAQLAVEFGCLPQIERFLDAAAENEAAIRQYGFDKWPDLPLRVAP